MKYGDLSSIVQLGVGLHVGTAVLQIYGELGFIPLERKLARTKALFRLPEDERPPSELEEEIERLESRYDLFKIDFFHQYSWFVKLNSIVAVLLAIVLVVVSVKADDVLQNGYELFAVLAIGLSYMPAPLTLGALYMDARERVRSLEEEAARIEERALESSS